MDNEKYADRGGGRNGTNILHLEKSGKPDRSKSMETIREKLFNHREKRIEDGRRGFPYLIQKQDMAVGSITFDESFENIFLQASQ